MDQSSSRENNSSNDNNSSSRGGQGSSSNSDSGSRGDGPTPTETTQGGDNSSSSDDNGPTTTQGGNDSSSSRDSGNGNGGGGASPTSSSTDNNDNNTSSRGGDNQTSSSRDSSSSSSEPSRSSSSSSDNSSTGGGGGAVSTSSDNAGPSSSSSDNAGPTSSSSSNNAGPTSSSSDASSSNSDSNGGAAGAGPSSASSQNNDSGSSRSLSTSTSYDVFVTSINGHAVTSTRTSVITSTPLPGERLSSGGSNYWNDSGAVGGTFAAVGIVAVALLAGLAWCLYRRRRAKRMDADVLAAASAAQATTRTPFDDDDDDVGPAGSYHTPGGTNAAGGTHPYYNPEYPASAGFHQPGHYAQISDEPYAPPPVQGSAMQEAAGAGSMVPASSAAFQYYTPQRTSASDDVSRGAYESVPTDHVYAYNQGPYDDGSAGLPTVSSAAAYTAAQTEPQPDHAYMAQGPLAPSMASGHTSQSADYELAPSHMTHPDTAVSYPQDAAMMPSFHAHEGHALDLSNQGHIRDSSSMGVPSTIYNAYHAPSLDSVPEPVQSTDSNAVASAPPVTAGGLLPVPITATDEAPPYVAGPNAPVVSDEKRPVASEAQPNDLLSASSEAPQGVTQAFGMDAEGQSALEHSEWDPPALSSAWFPTSEVPHQPTVHESVRMSGATTQGETVNTESAVTHTEGESALVEHAPARLVVRNPSPEEE